MLAAVDFHDYTKFEAEKIGNVRSNRNLAPELEYAQTPVSQGKP